MPNLRKPVTRTVVFADVVGSTGLYKSLGDSVAARLMTQVTQAVSETIARGRGRVVKTLGDGVLAVFEHNADAVAACSEVQRNMATWSQSGRTPVAVDLKIGMSRGPIVETPGDCFGDAVNAAARLSDSAGGGQILISDPVIEGLELDQMAKLRSLGAIFLRGYDNPISVHQIEWDASWQQSQTQPHQPTLVSATATQRLRLTWLDLTLEVTPDQTPVTIGRAPASEFPVNDIRVSRQHARVDWRGSFFLLTDVSSNGTWVRFHGQDNVLALRRNECVLHGEGEVCLGARPADPTAPTVGFQILHA
jgi:class 3 adenylate cyclase